MDALFYIFAGLTLLCGLMVVISRNPVTSAMFLVLTIISMAGLFVLLQAFFLAAVQVLVYAGAVMVLFLFVIMMLDLHSEIFRKIRKFSVITGILGSGALGFVMVSTIARSGVGNGLQPKVEGGTLSLAQVLFTDYLLPFEVVSVLLLVAMVGAVLLSKKDLQ